MSRRVIVMLFVTVLVGAIWAERPNSQTIRVISSARAQTAADAPAVTGAQTELPNLERMRTRQTTYVAAYSTIRLGGGKGKLDLATTLIVHNTSETVPLVVLRIDYFGTAGNLLQGYLANPIAIRPLGSLETFIPAEDTRGGTGANFIVEWGADTQITEPVIEAVMIGTLGTQGFSFTSRGQQRAIATPR